MALPRESAALVWGALGAAVRSDDEGVDVLVAAVPEADLRPALRLILSGVGRWVTAWSDRPEDLQLLIQDIAARHAAGGDPGE